MSRIAIIGTGYVGLTTGSYLAHIGHEVVCVDVIADKVEKLNRGQVPIYETGLEELVKSGLESGNLRFVVGSAVGVPGAEFVFLCLPTPQGEDGSADLSYIREEAERLGPILDTGAIVINKSTVPVGSTRTVERALNRGDVAVVSNPEFLREGSAVHDCLNPDRIVIGADDAAVASQVAALYDRIRAPVLVTDPASAELIKYASNAFLATKISYINAIANLCEVVGADVKEVVLGMGYDKRIGFEFLRPGPGWGGSCFHPDETLVVRRGDDIRLLTFAALFELVEELGPTGWEALSWEPDSAGPIFRTIEAFTCRPSGGSLVSLRTKMGRRLRVTPDHPMIVGDGVDLTTAVVKQAGELTSKDWLPVSLGFPDQGWEDGVEMPLESLAAAGLAPTAVILRCGEARWSTYGAAEHHLTAARRHDVGRTFTLRLHEALNAGLADELVTDPVGAGTTTNGTYIPTAIPMDEDLWRIVGLYLAEGSVVADGDRRRALWHFHPSNETELVDYVVSYWQALGVKTSVFHPPTSTKVVISSRILSAWLLDGLGLGANCYTKAVPDVIWTRPDAEKRALLRGLWDGDGSWSKVAGGPSVVFEYGTASRRLADGMIRLLGALGITARLKIGRTAKSTVDTCWISISGADQLTDCLWLFPASEREEILGCINRQTKRIRPTGYRATKGASWVRVNSVERIPYDGPVYSVEVAGTHTVVTTDGLVADNCFPKDTKALVKIAEDAGYDFWMLSGVIDVNVEQYGRMVAKIEAACPGGTLEGRTIGVWGLTFKAMTDDLRDSPAIEVIGRLRAVGANVQAYDPMVSSSRAERDPRLTGITVCEDAYAACAGADLVVVLTEWDEFRWLDFTKVREQLTFPTIVDCRNLLDPVPLRKRGFTYSGVGRV